jgi:hypothetical protein
MLYLEVKWSSLLPYEVSCDLLHDVLPVNEKLSAVTMRNHLFEVAERMEQELGEERPCLIEGCEQDWEQLRTPDGPLNAALLRSVPTDFPRMMCRRCGEPCFLACLPGC